MSFKDCLNGKFLAGFNKLYEYFQKSDKKSLRNYSMEQLCHWLQLILDYIVNFYFLNHY